MENATHLEIRFKDGGKSIVTLNDQSLDKVIGLVYKSKLVRSNDGVYPSTEIMKFVFHTNARLSDNNRTFKSVKDVILDD